MSFSDFYNRIKITHLWKLRQKEVAINSFRMMTKIVKKIESWGTYPMVISHWINQQIPKQAKAMIDHCWRLCAINRVGVLMHINC